MPEPTGTTVCANGHTMDPDWQVCPYCPGPGEPSLAATVRVPAPLSGSAGQPSSPTLDATVRVERPPELRGGAPELAPTVRIDRASEQALPPELAKTVRVDAEALRAAAAAPAPVRKTEFLERPPLMTAIGWLVAVAGPNRGAMHRLDRERVSVGASAECDAVIDSPHVSERHASIRCRGGEFVLTDLDSSNGTVVNGEAVHQHTLVDGDRVRFGSSEWVFKSVTFDAQ